MTFLIIAFCKYSYLLNYLHQVGYVIRAVCLLFCLSVSRITKKSNEPISLKLDRIIGPTNQKNWLTFGGALVVDTFLDYFSISFSIAQ